ncbi:MAG: helix-turn-helix transcriptional regulator [Alphaproteobacteria bacterium]|nr:helix-turn-helix transcriptional regulator [Alphaproteobacteria bacterium]
MEDLPEPVDLVIGKALRKRRMQMGYSQGDLGVKVKLGFQQVRKYERGESSISVPKLLQFCETLQVPIGYFFKDLGHSTAPLPTLTGRDAAEMQQLFDALHNPDVRRALLELARALVRVDSVTPTVEPPVTRSESGAKRPLPEPATP